MLLDVQSMSSAQLKGLKSGESISIRYAASQQEIEDGASRVIVDRFPRRVATAFSTTWAALLPSIHKTGLPSLSQPKTTSITVVGGSVDAVQAILRWCISCCGGRGLQPFPHSTIKPFTQYYTIQESADNMGIQLLSQEMSLRLNQLGSKQIHSEDIRAMYLQMPENHPILQDLAKHVADLIWPRKLRASNVYKTLREEITQFDQHVNAALEEQQAAQKPRQENSSFRKHPKGQIYGRHQTQKKETRNENLKYPTVTKKQAISKTQLVPKPIDDDKVRQEDTLSHSTIRCPVVRKARNGRPAYVHLPLTAVGVQDTSFVGNTFTSFFPTGPCPESVEEKIKEKAIFKTDHKSADTNESVAGNQVMTRQPIPDLSLGSSTSPTINKIGKNELDRYTNARESSLSSTCSSASVSLISTAESVDTVTTSKSFLIPTKRTSPT